MKIGIINTYTSNMSSVTNAINFLGFNNFKIITENTDENFSHIIMPGNGNYKSNMEIVIKNKLDKLIINHFEKNKFFLGICVGMQILSSYGYETKKEKGLNIIEGEVVRIPAKTERLPHIGWNELNIVRNNVLTKNLTNMSSFYFLHSYYFNLKKKENLIGSVFYEKELPVFIKKNNFFGVQFHPEKSQKNGLDLLNNFLNLK